MKYLLTGVLFFASLSLYADTDATVKEKTLYEVLSEKLKEEKAELPAIDSDKIFQAQQAQAVIEVDRNKIFDEIDKIEDHSIRYDLQDLLLDTSMAGIIIASKSRMEDDKYKHFVAGAVIGYTSTQISKLLFKNDKYKKLKSILVGVLMASAAAGLKEYRDAQGFGTPETKDVLYTIMGSGLSAIRFVIKF